MSTFKERVVVELYELTDRLIKLRAFFDVEMYATLPPAEQARLARQAQAMMTYGNTLKERIDADFK